MFRLFFILTLGFSILFSQDSLIVSKKDMVFTNFQADLYEDSSAKLPFEEIQKIHNFTPHKNNLSMGYTHSKIWFRFKIKNITDTKLKYFVKFKDRITDKTDCYIVKEDNTYKRITHGIGYLKDGETYHKNEPTFEFNLAVGETKTIYLSLHSKYSIFVSFDILNEDALHRSELIHDKIYSIYFGAMIALLLYNLFIYIIIREKAYLYYVLYVLSLLIWQLSVNGFFPFETYNSSFSFYMMGYAIPMWISMLIFFSRAILETEKLSHKIDTFLKYISYLFIILAITSMFFLYESFLVINALATFVPPYLLYIGYKSYKNGNKAAIFFIVAQLSFLSLSTLFSLMTNGTLEYTLLTRHGIVLGSFIEIILFSLALGYRIKLNQDEKLQIVRQANLELDEKVKERTKELERSQIKLKELASKDPLTNLYNRRSLFELVQSLVNSAKREKQNISLVMFDIDKFKNVNDTYGHAIGDIVIKEFANLINNTRESDIVARIGGEEFVLVLPNTDKDGAYKIAIKILESTRDLKIEVKENESLYFTVSGGVDLFNLDEPDALHQSLQRADRALYKAKISGRNRIILSSI